MSVYTQRDEHPFGHRVTGCAFQLEGHTVTAGRLGVGARHCGLPGSVHRQ